MNVNIKISLEEAYLAQGRWVGSFELRLRSHLLQMAALKHVSKPGWLEGVNYLFFDIQNTKTTEYHELVQNCENRAKKRVQR